MPSDENVEVVRRGWNAALQEPPDWNTLEALVDPQHELITLVGRVEGGQDARGVEGYRQWRERMNQTGEWKLRIDRLLPASPDRVVVLGTFRVRGGRSGAELSLDRGIVQTLSEGKLVRTEVFDTPADALTAAGLSE